MKNIYKFVIFLAASASVSFFAMNSRKNQDPISFHNEVGGEVDEYVIPSHASLRMAAEKALRDNDIESQKRILQQWSYSYDHGLDAAQESADNWPTYLQLKASVRMNEVLAQHKKFSIKAMKALNGRHIKKLEDLLNEWANYFDETRHVVITSPINYYELFVDYTNKLRDLTNEVNNPRQK